MNKSSILSIFLVIALGCSGTLPKNKMQFSCPKAVQAYQLGDLDQAYRHSSGCDGILRYELQTYIHLWYGNLDDALLTLERLIDLLEREAEYSYKRKHQLKHFKKLLGYLSIHNTTEEVEEK